jgi:hypothetical protein
LGKWFKEGYLMAVIIKPYVGIEDDDKIINFKMSRKEIGKILGEKAFKIEIDNIMKETREHRRAMVYKYEKGKLVDITFTANVNLIINGLNIFTEDEIIEKLKKFDNPTAEGKNGYMNFYKLGICLGGFGKKKIPEKKLVRAFCEERIKFQEFFIRM